MHAENKENKKKDKNGRDEITINPEWMDHLEKGAKFGKSREAKSNNKKNKNK